MIVGASATVLACYRPGAWSRAGERVSWGTEHTMKKVSVHAWASRVVLQRVIPYRTLSLPSLVSFVRFYSICHPRNAPLRGSRGDELCCRTRAIHRHVWGLRKDSWLTPDRSQSRWTRARLAHLDSCAPTPAQHSNLRLP